MGPPFDSDDSGLEVDCCAVRRTAAAGVTYQYRKHCNKNIVIKLSQWSQFSVRHDTVRSSRTAVEGRGSATPGLLPSAGHTAGPGCMARRDGCKRRYTKLYRLWFERL